LLTKINKNITFFHLLNLQGRPAGGGRWRSELAGVGVGRGRAAARAHHEPEAGSRPGAGGGAVLQAGGGRRRGGRRELQARRVRSSAAAWRRPGTSPRARNCKVFRRGEEEPVLYPGLKASGGDFKSQGL
jgi:hypothetical protein